MRRGHRGPGAAYLLAVAAAIVLTGCTSPGSSPASTRPPTGAGTPSAAVASTTVEKLLVVVVENHSFAQMQSEMPFTTGLATQYGYADDYVALTHPSLPNYIAMLAGDPLGVTDDEPPSAHPLPGPSVFGEAVRQGSTATVYVDAMQSPCQQEDRTATRSGTTPGVLRGRAVPLRRERRPPGPTGGRRRQRRPARGRDAGPGRVPRRPRLPTRRGGRVDQRPDRHGHERAGLRDRPPRRGHHRRRGRRFRQQPHPHRRRASRPRARRGPRAARPLLAVACVRRGGRRPAAASGRRGDLAPRGLRTEGPASERPRILRPTSPRRTPSGRRRRRPAPRARRSAHRGRTPTSARCSRCPARRRPGSSGSRP